MIGTDIYNVIFKRKGNSRLPGYVNEGIKISLSRVQKRHKKGSGERHRGKNVWYWWRALCSQHSVCPLVTLSFLEHKFSGLSAPCHLLLESCTHHLSLFCSVTWSHLSGLLWLSPHLLTQGEYACLAKRVFWFPGSWF